MNLTYTAKRAAMAVFVALFICAAGSTAALAQSSSSLHAACTNDNGSLFRVDNSGDREFDFTLMQTNGDEMSISGSAYPIGRGGAYAYLPAGAMAELVVNGDVIATASANMDPCPTASADAGRPVCEGLKLDPRARQALFVAAADYRGVSSIDITVNNGKVLVYDPHALFILDAGGSPAPVFEVSGGTRTFDAGKLFNAGYGLLLKGNDSGPVAFFATVHSPGGVVECDPQFAVTANETPDQLADAIVLNQNYPNPFKGNTEIGFMLDAPTSVTLQVHDLLGRKVATLVEGELAAGTHAFSWNGLDDASQRVASGTYFYRLEADGRMLSRTMTLLR